MAGAAYLSRVWKFRAAFGVLSRGRERNLHTKGPGEHRNRRTSVKWLWRQSGVDERPAALAGGCGGGGGGDDDDGAAPANWRPRRACATRASDCQISIVCMHHLARRRAPMDSARWSAPGLGPGPGVALNKCPWRLNRLSHVLVPEVGGRLGRGRETLCGPRRIQPATGGNLSPTSGTNMSLEVFIFAPRSQRLN